MKYLLACAAATWAVSALSAPLSKPIWQWTTEERLAARFDEAARIRRVEAFEAQRAVSHARATSSTGRAAALPRRPADSVHGSDHPELLMPFEIFTSFTEAAYGADDDVARHVQRDATAKALKLGLPPEFLPALRKQARAFIAMQREERTLEQQLFSGGMTDPQSGMARLRALQKSECASRADAMRNLRATFGLGFDKFLYSAIAPGVFRDFFEPVSAEALRAEEEGCK
jgi:hypothetical protein